MVSRGQSLLWGDGPDGAAPRLALRTGGATAEAALRPDAQSRRVRLAVRFRFAGPRRVRVNKENVPRPYSSPAALLLGRNKCAL